MSILSSTVQEEKEVLASLSRLDLNNVHFSVSPPGYVLFPMCFVGLLSVDVWHNIFFHHFLVLYSKIVKFSSSTEDVSRSVHLVAGEGLEAYLPLADMVDISAEVQRLSKRLSKMQMEYDQLVSRLSSPKVRIYMQS